MTKDDDALQAAIIDQINAELGAAGISMAQLSALLDRPYDSTRNYLRKERAMPLGVFLEVAAALKIPVEQIISRARDRVQR